MAAPSTLQHTLFEAMFNFNTHSSCRVEAVRILLKQGADPFTVGRCRGYKQLPFVKYAKTAHADIKVIEVFLESFDENNTPFYDFKAIFKESTH